MLAAVLGLAACAHGSEQVVLGRFFEASRLDDRTALDAFATVVFDPRAQGRVSRFDIEAVSPRRRRAVTAADAPVVERSLGDARAAAVGMIAEEVTVRAPVRAGGTASERRIVVAIERAVARDATGRWIVTGVRFE